MKKTNYAPNVVPTASVAVNKSRIKLYEKGVDMPTYYLQKGQEFQLEIFNPTPHVILTKIILNSKAISQGGLVLNPGQRVFLDRYLDVPKKFLFDTYEVSNTSEVKKAIESNGDIKIEFYKEQEEIKILPYQQQPWLGLTTYTTNGFYNGSINNTGAGTPQDFLSTRTSGSVINTSGNNDMVNYSSSISQNSLDLMGSLDLGMDSLKSLSDDFTPKHTLKRKLVRSAKTIETGRVEVGSDSSQTFKYVNKKFQYFPFHTIEYKLLPVSQKINTIDDLNVKVYCVNCGHKLTKTDKFCGQCGTKK